MRVLDRTAPNGLLEEATTEARRCLAGTTSALFAVGAFLLAEFAFTRLTGLSTVPSNRHQRALLVVQLAVLGGLAAAFAWTQRGMEKAPIQARVDSRPWAILAWLALGGLAACGGAFVPNFWPLVAFVGLAGASWLVAVWLRDWTGDTPGIWLFGVGWGLLLASLTSGLEGGMLLAAGAAAVVHQSRFRANRRVGVACFGLALAVMSSLEWAAAGDFWPTSLLGLLAFFAGVDCDNAVKNRRWEKVFWIVAAAVGPLPVPVDAGRPRSVRTGRRSR